MIETSNVFDRKLKPFALEKKQVLHSSDVLPGAIKQRHLEPNGFITFHGLAADRPDGSTQVKQYFATDTNVFSVWNGTAWKSTTLS